MGVRNNPPENREQLQKFPLNLHLQKFSLNLKFLMQPGPDYQNHKLASIMLLAFKPVI